MKTLNKLHQKEKFLEKDSLAYVENLLQEVLQKFSDITHEIPVRFNISCPWIALGETYRKDIQNSKSYQVSPEIIVGLLFFDLPILEQKALLAHELGHFKHSLKGLNRPRTSKRNNWILNYQALSHAEFANKDLEPIENRSHYIKRICQLAQLREIYADNQSIEAGYGKPLLDCLRKSTHKYHDLFSVMEIETNQKRIENLEQKLGEE